MATASISSAKNAAGRAIARGPSACTRALSVSASSSADQKDHIRVPKMTKKGAAQLAAMKKGPGYRSSFSGTIATVFGSSGMMGRAVCNRLGQNGSQLILPYRGDHYKMLKRKVCGDLGQVLFTPFHLKDEESIRRSMKYSNVVINLIGSEFPTRNFSLEDVHVKGAARLARLAREAGIERFIHMSHINAREKPPRIFTQEGSKFLRTKWLGEQAVLEEFPDATIFRASDIYGPEDKFLYYFFDGIRGGLASGVMPLWKKGEETIKSPVYFSDVASGIMNALEDPATKGEIFEAFGPQRFLFSELMDWMHEVSKRDTKDYGYRRVDLRFSPYVFMKALISERLPLGRKWLGNLTLDKLEREALTDEIVGLPNLYDLGVEPTKVTDKMPFELRGPLSAFAYFIPDSIHDDPVIPPPKALSRLEEKAVLESSRQSVTKMLRLS